jgi:hypothetical protein
MADQVANFEISDRQGTLEVYTGAVGIAWTAVPPSATQFLQEILVVNPDTNDFDEELSVSFDGGTTTAATFYPNGSFAHEIKGSLKQIWIKGSTASVNYSITIEKELESA